MSFKEGRNKENYTVFRKTPVFLNDQLPENIDLPAVLKRLEDELPWHFVEDLDIIYIGNFDFLIERDLNALYEDGAIYISSVQEDEEDLVDDLIHEMAHCAEDTYGERIYGNGEIENEFIIKRHQLFNILTAEGYDREEKFFKNTDYSKEFDEFLYIEVGYPALLGLTKGLFVSPYGATSLREYFANSFEEIYAKKNAQHVKKVSPSVYKTILNMND